MNELIADNLHLWRGEQHVLRGVCFELHGGQCLQVTGANGAGKTTLLRALCGLVPLEAGKVRWCGRDVAADPAAFHAQIDYLAHDNGLKADLTATENLRFAVRLRRRLQPGEVAAALARAGVAECAAALLRRLSAGQRRRVALARLLLSDGALWILDEPASNLDQRGQALLGELLEKHLAEGGAAVVATHQPLTLPVTKLLSLALQ
jgi:heme exporter protein A